MCFNVGLKNIQVGNKDYDIVHDVLVFNVLYVNKNSQEIYSYWPDYNGCLLFPGDSIIQY